MSKTIILMRHGQDDLMTSELTRDGKFEVIDVAQQMIDAGIVFDEILTSFKPRAQSTTKLLIETYLSAGIQLCQPKADKNISIGDATASVKKLDSEKIHSVLVVSHSYILYTAVKDWTNQRERVEPAHAFVLSSDTPSWEMIMPSTNTRLTRIFKPRVLAKH